MRTIRRVIAWILMVVLFVALGGAVSYVLMNREMIKLELEKNTEIELLSERIYALENIPKTSLIVTNRELKGGHQIEETDLMTVVIDTAIAPETIITDKQELIGKRLKTGLPMYGQLYKNSVYLAEEIPNDLREKEMSYIYIPMKAEQGDYFDLRIKFPTGQDYTVLAKKRLTGLERLYNEENVLLSETVWMNLDEKEIIRLESAVVDAVINNAHLYLIEYVEPFVQEASDITYPENFPVLEMISSNHQLVNEAEAALELIAREQLEHSLDNMSTDERVEFSKPIIEIPPAQEESDVQPVNEGTEASDPTSNDSSPDSKKESDNNAGGNFN